MWFVLFLSSACLICWPLALGSPRPVANLAKWPSKWPASAAPAESREKWQITSGHNPPDCQKGHKSVRHRVRGQRAASCVFVFGAHCSACEAERLCNPTTTTGTSVCITARQATRLPQSSLTVLCTLSETSTISGTAAECESFLRERNADKLPVFIDLRLKKALGRLVSNYMPSAYNKITLCRILHATPAAGE